MSAVADEKKLLKIVRSLPSERVAQLIDYARFLQVYSGSSIEEADLDELDEALWDRQFADSADVLQQMAEKALAEHRVGKTKPLEPDKL